MCPGETVILLKVCDLLWILLVSDLRHDLEPVGHLLAIPFLYRREVRFTLRVLSGHEQSLLGVGFPPEESLQCIARSIRVRAMGLLPEFYGDEAQLLELWLFFQEGANFTLAPLLESSSLIDESKESITSESKGLCISLDRDSDPIHHRVSPYRDLPAALLAEFFVSAKATFANFPRPS